MKERPIEATLRNPMKHWVGNGFYVSNYFPMGLNLMERFNPFFLLDYNEPLEFEPSSSQPGIGPHPHRGIETVSFAFEGVIEHKDNQGNQGILYPGDVQWMTAGRGIKHKEYHGKEFSLQGGVFHMVQLWINLPKASKFTEPRYQGIEKEAMGQYRVPMDGGCLRVVAGSYEGISGPAHTFTPMNVFLGDLKPFGSLVLREPAGYNLGILFTKGEGHAANQPVQHKDFLLFAMEEGRVTIKAGEEGLSFLVLSGEPLLEPIAAGGEFVMNTKEELEEAFFDRNNGGFGPSNF